MSPANLPLPCNPNRSALWSSRRQLQVAGAETERKNETLRIGRNITFDPHIESENCAGLRTNFFLLPILLPLPPRPPPPLPRIPLFLSIPNISSHSFKTKMYVPISGGGAGVRCLFVTAKRDFCGNGEKNCNRDLWSVSIDADLVFFFYFERDARVGRVGSIATCNDLLIVTLVRDIRQSGFAILN